MESLELVPDLSQSGFDNLTATDRDNGLDGKLLGLGLMPDGTTDGKPAVVLILALEDGRKVVAQTTLTLYATAARALLAAPVAQGHLP